LLALGEGRGGLRFAVGEVEVKDGLGLLQPLLAEACAGVRGAGGALTHGNLLGEELGESYFPSSYPPAQLHEREWTQAPAPRRCRSGEPSGTSAAVPLGSRDLPTAAESHCGTVLGVQ